MKSNQDKPELPTRAEINVFDDLDGRVACNHFLGKSLEDAEAMFLESSELYAEDLLWMGTVAFRFYVFAAIAYLKSPASAGDSYMVRSIAGTLASRLEWNAAELVPIAVTLADLCSYLANNEEKFGHPGAEWPADRTSLDELHLMLRELAAQR